MQNSKIKIFLIFIGCFSLFVLSFKFTLAYTLLEPLPGLGESVPEEGGLSTYASWLFTFALAAAAFLAVLMIVIGGIQIIVSGASESARKNAKDRIWNAIWGLLLAIAAWLILWTINPDLVKGTFGIEKVILEPRAEAPFPPPSGLSDSEARAQLENAGIQIKPGVSLEGIRQSTIDEIKSLKSRCPTCNIVVTSGTEGGHNEGTYSHANGYKVDLRLNNGLTNYIKSNFTPGPARSDGAPTWIDPKTGAVYALEENPPHWDVAVPPS